MRPKEVDGRWYIEVHTEEFGDILLLDKTKELSPVEFKNETEANEYIDRLSVLASCSLM